VLLLPTQNGKRNNTNKEDTIDQLYISRDSESSHTCRIIHDQGFHVIQI